MRATDTVARMGGDEFALVLRRRSTSAAPQSGRERREALAAAFDVEEVVASRVHASAGLALFPDHGADAAELMRRADTAMYRAKTLSHRAQVYAGDWHADALDRLTLVGRPRGGD